MLFSFETHYRYHNKIIWRFIGVYCIVTFVDGVERVAVCGAGADSIQGEAHIIISENNRSLVYQKERLHITRCYHHRRIVACHLLRSNSTRQ